MKYLDLVQVYEQLESTSKRLEKTYIIAEFLKKTDVKDLPKITLLLQGKLFPSWDEQKIGVASRLVLKAIKIGTGISEDNMLYVYDGKDSAVSESFLLPPPVAKAIRDAVKEIKHEH